MNFHEAGIPARLHQATWADFDLTSAWRDVQGWSDRYPEAWLPPTATPKMTGVGLLLLGGVGSGKTTAANLVLKNVLAHDHLAWFCPAPTLETLLHRQMDLSTLIRKADEVDNDTVEKFEQIMSRLDRARMKYFVLCIDDWGRERTTSQFLQDYVEGLVRERFNRGLPTIITSNSSVEQIERDYGAAWSSFMQEAFITVDFGNRDRRGAG